jgi:hypothetical protein
MIVVGNPAVLMNDKHWLSLLLTCQQHCTCTGQPMPDMSEAAATAAGGSQGRAGAAGSSAAAGIAGAAAVAQAGSSGAGRQQRRSNLQLQVVQLEKLLASIAISQAVDEVAEQQLLLQETLGFSGLVDEAEGGMVRHE